MAKPKTKEKDKFDKLYDTLAGELKTRIPTSYNHKGKTYEISDNVREVAADMFATEFAETERVDERYRNLDVSKKDVKGEDGLADYFRKVSEGLGSKADYTKASSTEIVGQLRGMLGNYGHLVDSFLKEGDTQVLNVLPNFMSQNMKQQAKIKSSQKMYALKGKDGNIDPDTELQLSTAMASMKAMSGLFTISPHPYSNATRPQETLDSVVSGLRSQDGGVYSTAPNAEKLVQQYAN